jgi:hypothetical protein
VPKTVMGKSEKNRRMGISKPGGLCRTLQKVCFACLSVDGIVTTYHDITARITCFLKRGVWNKLSMLGVPHMTDFL